MYRCHRPLEEKGTFQTGKKTLTVIEERVLLTGTGQEIPSEVQWTLRKGTTEGVQVVEMTTHVEGTLRRGVAVTMTGVHLRENIDTAVLLTQTNILIKEKKEMNALAGGKNIVAIPLMRTKLYNSLSPLCCAFLLSAGYMHGRNGNAK